MDNNTNYIAYIGGVRSGKSKLAENKILSLTTKGKPIYLATAKIIDDEMKKRVQSHKDKRKDSFLTIEEDINITKVIKEAKSPILVESITMWINNMLFEKKGHKEILSKIEDILVSTGRGKSIVFVKDIVGLGITPPNKLARDFIDISGEVDQLLGKYCHELYFVLAGCPVNIK